MCIESEQRWLPRNTKLLSDKVPSKGNLPGTLYIRDYIDIADNKTVRLDVHWFNSVNDLSRHNVFCVHYIPMVI